MHHATRYDIVHFVKKKKEPLKNGKLFGLRPPRAPSHSLVVGFHHVIREVYEELREASFCGGVVAEHG